MKLFLRSLLIVSACLLSLVFWVYSQGTTQVGYSIITASTGGRPPISTALYSFTDPASGVLVWEAAVGATEPIRSGRIFVDRQGGTETAVALVNPSFISAVATLILRDSFGAEVSSKIQSFGPGIHLAQFVNEMFPSVPAGFTGSLTFETGGIDQKLAAVTLRWVRQGSSLFTTLPVVDLGVPESVQPFVFPHVAGGQGWSTQVVLINRSSQTISGRISLTASDGSPMLLELGGVASSQFNYVIGPNGTYRAELTKALGGVVAGYAVVTPTPGSISPAGSAIFRFKAGNRIITEAGVAATAPTTLARIFVDYAGTWTGVAAVNPSNVAVPVTFDLLNRVGISIAKITLTLPPRSHLSRFVHEIFRNVLALPDGFTGLMEISAPTAIVPITLKLTTNELGETVLTTLPVADLTQPVNASFLVIPQVAFGGGYSTRLISINSSKTVAASGTLSFFQSSGFNLTVPLGGQTGSQFAYQLAPGVGKQFRPGNTATPQRIIVDIFDAEATEITVNRGNTLQLLAVVEDSGGELRDDFPFSYGSISTEFASVNALGIVQGNFEGFSTLIVSAGNLSSRTTITVVKVTSGGSALSSAARTVKIGQEGKQAEESAFGISGVAQAIGGPLYLAATKGHVILQSENLQATPVTYAGTVNTAGFRNGERLSSLFRGPTSLAVNSWELTLFVSDSANHVIRQIDPGEPGRVQTLAGASERAGSNDGPLAQARFKNPQGIALDDSGFLWVVDSGNHTVRRIDFIKGIVETIAGQAGRAGFADGIGAEAQFDSPTGITVERETEGARLLREQTVPLPPPPPVTVLLADTGNNVIRRVTETGLVTTVQAPQAEVAAGQRNSARYATRYAATGQGPRFASNNQIFASPTAVAVDPSGNIYVAEKGEIKTLLSGIGVVSAAQDNTFSSPQGIVISEGGKILVADSSRSAAQQIVYGKPEISAITPNPINNRGGATVSITGRSFAPDTLVVVGGEILDTTIADTKTIQFTPPNLPSGRTTVTVQHRGGLTQTQWTIEPIPLSQTSPGRITTVAGGSTFAGDGLEAARATLTFPSQIAVDSAGNYFIADSGSHRVRRVDARTQIITTVAGTGTIDYSRDGGLATASGLAYPLGIAIDSAGNLYIADSGTDRVRKVDARGIITTVAGTGVTDYEGDGGPAVEARLNTPQALAFDGSGNLLIADTYNRRIRKLDFRDKKIYLVAGNGNSEFSSDGQKATESSLGMPTGLAVDKSGNIYVADVEHNRIRKVDAATGIMTTYAGSGSEGYSGDGGPATSASLFQPRAIAFDRAGNLYIADAANDVVRRVDGATRIISTVAGNGNRGFGQDQVPPTATSLSYPEGVAVDSAGSLYIADSSNHRIRKIARVGSPAARITTVAGSFRNIGDNDRAAIANLAFPFGVAVDAAGNLFVADTVNFRVRKIAASDGRITTVAGNGDYLYLPEHENKPATEASLFFPTSVAVDSSGNLYIADAYNSRVRKVAANRITTLAGNGEFDYSGDGGAATSAALNYPLGLAVDKAGNVFIADTDNSVVRRVDAQTGIITTVAGNGKFEFSGDGKPATEAGLYLPEAVALDAAGNLFISDSFNDRVRRVDVVTKIITTYAGNEFYGFAGDGGPATKASLFSPEGLAFDAAGNLLIADGANNRIRRVDAQSGVITTVIGNGLWDPLYDNGPARIASLDYPTSVAVDPSGNLFIADNGSNRIRSVRAPVYPPLPTPNLAPYKPEGWSGPIVVSDVKGTSTNGNLIAGRPSFIDWAIVNNGDLAIPQTIYYELWIDGEFQMYWYSPDGLNLNTYTPLEDYAVTLPPGEHFLTIIADTDDTVAESDETDNYWTFSGTWTGGNTSVLSRSNRVGLRTEQPNPAQLNAAYWSARQAVRGAPPKRKENFFKPGRF